MISVRILLINIECKKKEKIKEDNKTRPKEARIQSSSGNPLQRRGTKFRS